MKIIQRHITKNNSYRNNVDRVDSRYTVFQQRGPLGLMLHSVGSSQPNAEVFYNNWNMPNIGVSVHAVLQSDGTVLQLMPWNFRAWHCGGSANNTHVGVEMTEPACIRYTGGASFTCSDLAAAQAQVRGTYQTAVELFAQLCKQYSINPKTGIVSHAEGCAKGIASNHGDPEHLWRQLGMPYTMDTFRADVARKVEEERDLTKAEVQAMIDANNAKLFQTMDSKDRAAVSANNETLLRAVDQKINAALTGEGTQPSPWATEELASAMEHGITDGQRPRGYATREEAAIMVERLRKELENETA